MLLNRRLVIVFALLVMCGSRRGFAQEATLTGIITDSSGGVLPGVTITAVHTASGNNFVVVTDDGGYRIPLRIGEYRISAELPGFGTATKTASVQVGQTIVINLQMAVSTVQETAL